MARRDERRQTPHLSNRFRPGQHLWDGLPGSARLNHQYGTDQREIEPVWTRNREDSEWVA